jgi:two-component system NarL family response regulator
MFDSYSRPRTKVAVSHREPLLRAGIASVLRAHADFEVSTQLVEVSPNAPPPFDVIVTDYDSGLRLARDTARASHPGSPAPQVLVLTAADREADIRRAVDAGVRGYLLLDTEPSELVEGVAAVARGSRYWCRSVVMRMVDSVSHIDLTARETEVLQLVADGEPNKGIARQLAIEIGTVKSHISAIMGKLGANSRTHAVRIGTARGLVMERAMAPA